VKKQLHLAKCPNCGLFEISDQAFAVSLSAEMKRQIAVRAPAPIVLLRFRDCCPECIPGGPYYAALSLLRPRRNAFRRGLDRLLRVPKAVALTFGLNA
jgi:hypothetical protein